MFSNAFNVHPEKEKFVPIPQPQRVSQNLLEIFLIYKLSTEREKQKKGATKNAP